MDLQALIEQLYENESLTDNMTDEAAQVMLNWGQQQLAVLQVLPPDQLEKAAHQLQLAMRAINRLIGQSTELSEAELVESLLGLVERAARFGQQYLPPQAPTGE